MERNYRRKINDHVFMFNNPAYALDIYNVLQDIHNAAKSIKEWGARSPASRNYIYDKLPYAEYEYIPNISRGTVAGRYIAPNINSTITPDTIQINPSVKPLVYSSYQPVLPSGSFPSITVLHELGHAADNMYYNPRIQENIDSLMGTWKAMEAIAREKDNFKPGTSEDREVLAEILSKSLDKKLAQKISDNDYGVVRAYMPFSQEIYYKAYPSSKESDIYKDYSLYYKNIPPTVENLEDDVMMFADRIANELIYYPAKRDRMPRTYRQAYEIKSDDLAKKLISKYNVATRNKQAIERAIKNSGETAKEKSSGISGLLSGLGRAIEESWGGVLKTVGEINDIYDRLVNKKTYKAPIKEVSVPTIGSVLIDLAKKTEKKDRVIK